MMAVQTGFENEVRDRLSRLERELRYWRLAGILTLSLATVVVAAAMDDPPPKELRAETIKIVEHNGKERIILTAVPGIPDMTFLDPAGESRLTLDIADDHKPVLSVSDLAKGKGRLVHNHEVRREPKGFLFHCGIFSQLTDRTSGSMLSRDITSWIARSLRSIE
jgi:hypothetical protein